MSLFRSYYKACYLTVGPSVVHDIIKVYILRTFSNCYRYADQTVHIEKFGEFYTKFRCNQNNKFLHVGAPDNRSSNVFDVQLPFEMHKTTETSPEDRLNRLFRRIRQMIHPDVDAIGRPVHRSKDHLQHAHYNYADIRALDSTLADLIQAAANKYDYF